MDILASDGAPRDLRRYLLAWRLMARKVRTHTIWAMTAFSRHKQRRMRRGWGITGDMRHRGPSPTSLERFTCSPRARSEGAAIVAFCRLYGGVLPSQLTRVPRHKLLTLELGERLCPTYEAFHACLPQCKLEFEDLMSLVLGIARNEDIRLGRCASCGATLLSDRLAPRHRTCPHCQEKHIDEAGGG